MTPRHPDLHQDPECIEMPATRKAAATIEIGQHIDGRWMWAIHWRDGCSGQGFCLSAKWGRFASSRQAALDAAIVYGLRQTEESARVYNNRCPNVRAWLQALSPPQGELFETAVAP